MARILIVDDSSMMRRNLRKVIEDAGHSVVAEISNGSDACVAYEQHQPDLVTMDITMPYMDGIEAVKTIVEVFPNARIVMISAHGQEDKIYKAIKAGAKSYIVKPIRPVKVATVIDQVLRNEKSIAT
jgi:two-component system chemotaxis response regulator CheY